MNKMLIAKKRFDFLSYSKSYFWLTNQHNALSKSVISSGILKNIGLTLAMNLELRKEYIGNELH